MRTTSGFLLLLLCCAALPPALAGADFEWQTTTPESQGLSSAKLDALRDDLAANKTAALLVIRNDRIVCEWYVQERSPTDRHMTASLAKAVVGGMSLAVAVHDGLISLDDKASKYVPQWAKDPLRSQITVRHLGSHTSGIQDAWNDQEAAAGVDQGKFSGWEGEFWRWRNRQPGEANDAFTLARDTAPVLFVPGTEHHYSNPGIAMLTYCVTASLKGSKHPDVRTLLRERIMGPIGVPDAEWVCGYGKTEIVDGLPLVANWGGGNYSPRALARLGRLVLRKGDWEGRQILSAEAVRQVTADSGLPKHCGMGWWTNAGGRYSTLPKDAVWGAGAGHQILLVVPTLDLIAVRMGGDLDGKQRGNENALGQRLFNPLMATISDP